MKRLATIAIALCLGLAAPALGQTSWPNQREGDFVLRNFRFGDGATLPELRIHYLTFGTARKNAAGEIVNGVLLLHGTSGSSASWLTPSLADELFASGQPLDASQYFLIVPDAIGAGRSSKPSDGLRGAFPHYRYRDMVEAQYRLLTEGLGIRHLRLVLGTSMGGMQSWMWGETYPDFMDGLVPIASQPTAMSGRNWITRRVRIEAIRNDPDWNGGNYEKNPTRYVYTLPLASLMTESVVTPAGDGADPRGRRRAVQKARRGRQEKRRQQSALCDRSRDGLRPVEGSREDPCASARNQLRRRCPESSGAGGHGAGNRSDSACPAHHGPSRPGHTRPLHVLPGGALEDALSPNS